MPRTFLKADREQLLSLQRESKPWLLGGSRRERAVCHNVNWKFMLPPGLENRSPSSCSNSASPVSALSCRKSFLETKRHWFHQFCCTVMTDAAEEHTITYERQSISCSPSHLASTISFIFHVLFFLCSWLSIQSLHSLSPSHRCPFYTSAWNCTNTIICEHSEHPWVPWNPKILLEKLGATSMDIDRAL